MGDSYVRTGFITAAAVIFAVGTAAAGGGEKKMGDGKMSGAAAAGQMSGDFSERHTMEGSVKGSVTKIDNAKGTFSLETGA